MFRVRTVANPSANVGAPVGGRVRACHLRVLRVVYQCACWYISLWVSVRVSVSARIDACVVGPVGARIGTCHLHVGACINARVDTCRCVCQSVHLSLRV